jgi:hypothetical protein
MAGYFGGPNLAEHPVARGEKGKFVILLRQRGILFSSSSASTRKATRSAGSRLCDALHAMLERVAMEDDRSLLEPLGWWGICVGATPVKNLPPSTSGVKNAMSLAALMAPGLSRASFVLNTQAQEMRNLLRTPNTKQLVGEQSSLCCGDKRHSKTPTPR